LSSVKMVAPAVIGGRNWLSTGVGGDEAAVAGEIETGALGKSTWIGTGRAGIGETGAGKTDAGEMGADAARPVGADETEAGGGAVGLCVGTLENE
jgi:hypothetical protein